MSQSVLYGTQSDRCLFLAENRHNERIVLEDLLQRHESVALPRAQVVRSRRSGDACVLVIGSEGIRCGLLLLSSGGLLLLRCGCCLLSVVVVVVLTVPVRIRAVVVVST